MLAKLVDAAVRPRLMTDNVVQDSTAANAQATRVQSIKVEDIEPEVDRFVFLHVRPSTKTSAGETPWW